MSGPFPRFTSGGIGSKDKHLTAEHVNRITDATIKVESMPDGSPSAKTGRRTTFFAKLVLREGTDLGAYGVWRWSSLAVNSAGNDVEVDENQIASSDFKTGQGLAVDLGGSGAEDQIVLLHELVCRDGVRRFGFGAAGGSSLETWCLLNATVSGGSFTTGVTPTDLGDGIFEYKGVPVKITGYSAGVFTYEQNDDPTFDFEGTSVTVLNPPTHENDADWKYAGVSTGAGSDYPAGYDIRGIGEDRVAATWHSVLVKVQLYTIPADGEVEEQKLWLMMAEPDHDGSCESGGDGGGEGFVPGFFGGS